MRALKGTDCRIFLQTQTKSFSIKKSLLHYQRIKLKYEHAMSQVLKIKKNTNNVKVNIFFIMRRKRGSMSSVNLTNKSRF